MNGKLRGFLSAEKALNTSVLDVAGAARRLDLLLVALGALEGVGLCHVFGGNLVLEGDAPHALVPVVTGHVDLKEKQGS